MGGVKNSPYLCANNLIINTFHTYKSLMKKVLFFAASLLLVSLASCDYISKKASETLGMMSMDEAGTYEYAEELVNKIEPEWKVYNVSVSNKGPHDHCSNTLGFINVQMINADNNRVYQNLYPQKDAPSRALSESPDFDQMPEFKFTAESAMKNIEDCKNLIPEGFKFLNLERYTARVKSDKTSDTDIVINVQEIGKENVTAGGVTSSVYYSLRFIIDENGEIRMIEN